MIIINKTRIDNGLLHEIIEFVRPPMISDFQLEVCIGLYCGIATTSNQITIFITPKEPPARSSCYDHSTDKERGYVGTRIQNEFEMLVFVIAHELRHVWQRENYDTNEGWFTNELYCRGNSILDGFSPPARDYDA